MAYSGASERRLAGSIDYAGSESTLNSEDVKGPKDMDNGGKKIVGDIASGTPGKKLIGPQVKQGMSSGLVGKMSGGGYPGGPRQQRQSSKK